MLKNGQIKLKRTFYFRKLKWKQVTSSSTARTIKLFTAASLTSLTTTKSPLKLFTWVSSIPAGSSHSFNYHAKSFIIQARTFFIP
jgi:hypothetical protein